MYKKEKNAYTVYRDTKQKIKTKQEGKGSIKQEEKYQTLLDLYDLFFSPDN